MVPKYDPGVVHRTTDRQASRLLHWGTLVEQTLRRLEGGEVIHQMVLEGHARPEDLNRFLTSEVLRGVLEPTGEPVETPLAEVARILHPFARGSEQEAVLHAIDLLSANPKAGIPIARELVTTGILEPGAIELVLSLFQIRNSQVRIQALEKLPAVIRRLREEGRSLVAEASSLKVGRLTATEFIGTLLLRGSQGNVTRGTWSDILELPANSPTTRRMIDRFHASVVHIEGSPAETWLNRHGTELLSLPLTERVDFLYRLSLLARCESFPEKIETMPQLNVEIARALGDLLGISATAITSRFRDNEHSLETALALALAYRDLGDPSILTSLSEAMEHIVSGDYKEWRYDSTSKRSGEHTRFLADRPEWWRAFSENGRLRGTLSPVEGENVSFLLEGQKQRFDRSQETASEADWVFREVKTYDSLDTKERGHYRLGLTTRQQKLAQWASQRENIPPPLVESIIQTFGPTHGEINPSDLRHFSRIRSDLYLLQAWLDVTDALTALKARNLMAEATQNLPEALLRLEWHYRSHGLADIADEWGKIRKALATQRRKGSGTTATVEETDDYFAFLHQGQLTAELVNCFNQDGNPVFNQYIVTTLGSPNMKLLIAKDESGKPIGVAMMKVKQLEDGRAVLFLERGLYARDDVAVQGLMEQLIKEKAVKLSSTGVHTLPMKEAPREQGPEDIIVKGIGAFTRTEYVESVFGLRSSHRIRHRGRLIP